MKMLHRHHHMFCLALLLCGVACSDDNPVYIHDADDLIKFSGNVNSETKHASTTVYLVDDIDFTGKTMEPIGNLSNRCFLGTFDGQGHTISNLKMNVTTSDFAGLFGYSTGSTIKDVVVDGSCSIMNSFIASSDHCVYIGGIIGQCHSINDPCIIENIVNMARVSFKGNVPKDLHLGGIVGVGWALNNYNVTVKNCVNFGDVAHEGTVGRYCDIGGIVGHFISGLKYIQNCINYGTIRHNGTTVESKYIGGIVGFVTSDNTINEAIIENCLSAGEVRSNNDTLCSKRSVVGHVESITNITHCFWTNATGCDTAYGINDTNVTITNSSHAELNADLLRVMNEYAKQNTNTSSNSSSFNEYHVLHLNGGRINSIAQETLLVTQPRFPTPLKEGTAFLFWCGDISCNATYNASDSSASGMVDVYAIWNTSTVTFNFMNGSDSLSFVNDTFQFNTNITYPKDVVREGYTHSGWEPAYSLMPGADVTLYAQWTPNNYTVTLDVNRGNKLSISTITVTFNTTYGNLPEASRDGHTFIGWFNEKGVINERITSETTVIIADNHTLYAQWKEIPTSQVEIVFGTKDLTEEEIKDIIRQYTDDEFTILKLDTSEQDEVRVIVAFADAEIAEEFVENVQTSSDSAIGKIKDVQYNSDYFISYSATLYSFALMRLFNLL